MSILAAIAKFVPRLTTLTLPPYPIIGFRPSSTNPFTCITSLESLTMTIQSESLPHFATMGGLPKCLVSLTIDAKKGHTVELKQLTMFTKLTHLQLGRDKKIILCSSLSLHSPPLHG